MEWEEFKSAALLFSSLSCEHHDTQLHWKWIESKEIEDNSGFGYLSKINSTTLQSHQQEDKKASEEQIEFLHHSNVDEENDDLSETQNPSSLLILHHHIIYSNTYRVPVMLFNVYNQDGELFTPEQIDILLSSHFPRNRDFVTQVMHPVLSVPFYQIHPCQTSILMKNVVEEKGKDKAFQFLLTWLSLVSPIVHLKLSIKWFQKPSN